MESKFYPIGTESDQAVFIEENVCPVCGEEVSHGGTHVKLKTMITQWSCYSCGSEGEEVFDIEFAGQRVNVELTKENRDN